MWSKLSYRGRGERGVRSTVEFREADCVVAGSGGDVVRAVMDEREDTRKRGASSELSVNFTRPHVTCTRHMGYIYIFLVP